MADEDGTADTMSVEGPDPDAAGSEGPVGMDAEHITTSTRDPQEMAEHLEGWLAERVGRAGSPSITDVSSPESNGMSSETLLFTARWDEAGTPTEHRLVARIEPPATDYPVFTTYDLDMQFRVMRLVRAETKVPVPETFWYEPDPSVLGGPFFVMERIDGLVPPDVLPYTFGDNWVFDASPRRTPGHAGVGRRDLGRDPRPSPRTGTTSNSSSSTNRARRPSTAVSAIGATTTIGWSRTGRPPCWPSASLGWPTTSLPMSATTLSRGAMAASAT